MPSFSTFAEAFLSLSTVQIGAVIVLAAFGLAAFTIYVVFEIAKDRHK